MRPWQAGDLIDNNIGVLFGFSTLTAAAIGQIFSDVSGSSGPVLALPRTHRHGVHSSGPSLAP